MREVAFSDVFGHLRSIPLQQDDSNLIARVGDVGVGPDGDIALADPAEGNVKVYRSDGRLRSVLGRRGTGPGEFSGVSEIRFTPSGSVLAWDGRRRVFVEYGRDGELRREVPVPDLSLDDFAVVEDGRIAAVGRYLEAPEQALHLFSSDGRHEASFLDSSATAPVERPAHSYWPPLQRIIVDVLDAGTAVVASQVSDSVWAVDLEDGAIRAHPLTYSGRHVPTLPDREFATMQEMADEWITELQLVNRVHGMDGTTLVSLATGRRDSAVIDLVLIDGSGTRLVLKDAPLVLSVQGGDLLALENPGEADVTLSYYRRVGGR